jgi:hypothetical protein
MFQLQEVFVFVVESELFGRWISCLRVIKWTLLVCCGYFVWSPFDLDYKRK